MALFGGSFKTPSRFTLRRLFYMKFEFIIDLNNRKKLSLKQTVMTRLLSSRVPSTRATQAGKWHIRRFFERFDSLGRDVPAINLNGRPEVNTCFGGFMTVVIITVTFLYASMKLVELIQNTNPTISDITVPEYFSNTDYVSTDEMNFKMAFTMFNTDPGRDFETVYDPRYVKLVVMDADYDFFTEDPT